MWLQLAMDFHNANTNNQLQNTMLDLMALNIISIINAKDVTEPGFIYNDNNSIACAVAAAIHADLAILICDLDRIHNKPPREEGARRLAWTSGHVGQVHMLPCPSPRLTLSRQVT